MKKGIIFFGWSIFFLSGCNTVISNKAPKQTDELQVGTDHTANGCKASAGYTWSNLRKECVRLFESGTRLNPLYLEEDQPVISAFVLYNSDQSKIELFLPNWGDKTVILAKNKEGDYSDSVYLYRSQNASLWKDGKEIYVLDKME